MRELTARLATRRARGLYRERLVLASAQGVHIRVGDETLLSFCSNDYLGLAGDPRVRAAFTAAIARWGTGAGASHLVCGHTAAHEALELALADFTGRPRVLLYSSGYGANVGVINALLSVGDVVFEDRLNHASLLDGGRISRATFTWFDHLDTVHLERELDAVADATADDDFDALRAVPKDDASGRHCRLHPRVARPARSHVSCPA